MLNDWAMNVLKANRIDPETVEDVSGDMQVTFKDGTQKTICEVWSRVMGYCRPTTEYNVGKRAEFEDRKCFTEAAAVAHLEDYEGPDDAA